MICSKVTLNFLKKLVQAKPFFFLIIIIIKNVAYFFLVEKKKNQKKGTRIVGNMKRKHSEANQDPSNLSQRITIDGHTPRNPKPQLCLLRTESQFVVGRQRSTDLKGILTELIEEFYPPLVCAICLDVSATRADSDMHFKAKHRGEKAFECLGHDCQQAYSSRSGLRYHLLTNHQVTGDRGYAACMN